MPRYLTQTTATPEWAATMMANPQDRTEYLRSIVESAGGKLEDSFFEVGGDAAYSLIEMPDQEGMAALAYAVFASEMASSVKVTPIMRASEAVEAFKKASSISYQPPSS